MNPTGSSHRYGRSAGTFTTATNASPASHTSSETMAAVTARSRNVSASSEAAVSSSCGSGIAASYRSDASTTSTVSVEEYTASAP